jgi:hypothetical protein
MKRTLAPGVPQDSLHLKTEQIFQAIGRLRKNARDEVDRLIRFLDETDDHMEREALRAAAPMAEVVMASKAAISVVAGSMAVMDKTFKEEALVDTRSLTAPGTATTDMAPGTATVDMATGTASPPATMSVRSFANV